MHRASGALHKNLVMLPAFGKTTGWGKEQDGTDFSPYILLYLLNSE